MLVPQHENHNVNDMPVPQHRNYNVNPRHEIWNKNISASIGPKRQKINSNPKIIGA